MKGVKKFCIEKLREYMTKWRQIASNDDLGEFSNWENELNKKNDIKSIYDYTYKVAKKMWEVSAWKWSVQIGFFSGENFLKSFGENKYYQFLTDLITDLETEKDTFENLAKNYELGLKGIIGNDLTNWETKITKTGINDKDITDLRKKITDLQTAKDNLDKELKNKQQQILDHRCDTPNNDELNQTKGELDKANKEITSLKKQLDNRPNSPNDKEEERKEEQENNNLTLEQLKEKLKTTRQEIKSLHTQLNQQKNQANHHDSYGLGTLFVIGIVCLLFGSLITFIAKKKKKQDKNQ